jgi:hypothetical protein
MDMDTKAATKRAIVAAVTAALLGIAAPLAVADNIGAPTSAAGGVSAPTSPSRPAAAGPLGSSGGSTLGGGSISGDYEPLKLQPRGTGKFEGPNNGTSTPCVGSTGFGSSATLPGHRC